MATRIALIKVGQVTQADLQELVDDQVREGLRLEYKQELPGKGDDAMKEFLKDVTGLANAEGGDLLFGIEEGRDDLRGVAVSITGLDPELGEDEQIRRLENSLANNVDPPIHGVRPVAIRLANGRWVLHLRVPRSLDIPHMVNRAGHRQFWVRHSASAAPMTASEVRGAVLRSRDLQERVDRWRHQRVDHLEAGEGIGRWSSRGRLYVHVVPLAWEGRLDVATASFKQQLSVNLEHRYLNEMRLNFDGYVQSSIGHDGSTAARVQWFADGRVEVAVSGLVTPSRLPDFLEDPLFDGLLADKWIVSAVEGAVRTLRALEVDYPLLVGVTVADVDGAWLHDAKRVPRYRELPTFDRGRLPLPALLVTEDVANHWSFLKATLDHVWRAAGHQWSYSFDQQGRRRDWEWREYR